MKKIFCFFALLTVFFGVNLHSDEKSFNYTSIGGGINVFMPIPVPNIQIGHREVYGEHAIDTSLGFSTAIIASALQTNVNIIKYINSNRLYLGGGLTAQLIIMPVDPFAYFQASIPFIIGKESDKNFSQIKISAASYTGYGMEFAPYVTYQYGFKF